MPYGWHFQLLLIRQNTKEIYSIFWSILLPVPPPLPPPPDSWLSGCPPLGTKEEYLSRIMHQSDEESSQQPWIRDIISAVVLCQCP